MQNLRIKILSFIVLSVSLSCNRLYSKQKNARINRMFPYFKKGLSYNKTPNYRAFNTGAFPEEIKNNPKMIGSIIGIPLGFVIGSHIANQKIMRNSLIEISCQSEYIKENLKETKKELEETNRKLEQIIYNTEQKYESNIL